MDTIKRSPALGVLAAMVVFMVPAVLIMLV